MNSYFEQSGFYGHPHQTAAGMMSSAASHHDQASAAAAYRGFPLSLGMSSYVNHHLHQTRSPHSAGSAAASTQDLPYDASVTGTAAAYHSKQIYEGSLTGVVYNNKECSKSSSGTAADTNGYKDVWNATTGASAAQSTGSSVPVRPSACTPDSRVSGYIDAAAGSPASRTGSTVGSGTAAWNANCGIGTPSAQTATSGLHQSNHTFYPWMAIAGESPHTNYLLFTYKYILLFILCETIKPYHLSVCTYNSIQYDSKNLNA